MKAASQASKNYHEMCPNEEFVFTLRNAPEWLELKALLDLQLTELMNSTFWYIVPPSYYE
jgi:hypothetical protein